MKSAFCCATLKTGSLIVGWLTLVVLVLITISTSIQAGSGSIWNQNGDNNTSTFFNEFEGEMSLTTYLYLFYIFFILEIVALVCLLYGTNKSRPSLLIPYLVIYGIAVASNIILLVFRFVTGVHWIYLIPKLVAAPIGIYFLCIVKGHHTELRSQYRAPRNQAPDETAPSSLIPKNSIFTKKRKDPENL